MLGVIVAMAYGIESGRFQHSHAQTKHSLFRQTLFTVVSVEVGNLFRSVVIERIYGKTIVLVNHIVVNNLDFPIRGNEDLAGVETEGRFEQREGQVATLQDTPQLVLIKPLALLLPGLYLVLQGHLRVFIDCVDLMRSGAESTDGDLLELDDTQNIVTLAVLNLPLKPLLCLFNLPIQAIGELLEQEGSFGETLQQHHPMLLSPQLLVLVDQVDVRLAAACAPVTHSQLTDSIYNLKLVIQHINNVNSIMKNSSNIKNVDFPFVNPTIIPKTKHNERESQSPLRIDLKLKILNHSNSSNPTNFRTKQDDSKSKQKQQQSTQILLTERTTGINEFLLSAKQSLLPTNKGLNIKSYLRIKPNKSPATMPLEIYNNQTIICDRAVYKFDFIFEPLTPQMKVYEVMGKEVANQFLQGYNGTIFAYGSTGSGKTFTMFGQNDGLVPCVVEQIFAKLDDNSKLSCSMIEIYKQNLIDLLSIGSEAQLKIKEVLNNYTIQNLSMHQVSTREEALSLIQKGNNLKKIRETNLNESSSRSHIVFTLYLQKIDAEGKHIKCKFNLVDLAGSQKVFKSKVQGEGLEEAKKINLSLSCLGNTIGALVKNSDHIPYRQSKLTRILKESLMGNSITRLIVTCSLNDETIEQTISSIKFAQRAQKVQTQASIAYNINKFKGTKQERLRLLKQSLEQAELKLSQINDIVCKQSDCNNCKQVKEVLQRRKEVLPVEEMFRFKPIEQFKSPKAKVDLRQFFSTGSVQKYSSFRYSNANKNAAKHSFLFKKEEKLPEYNQFMNKRMFELKNENEKLLEEKRTLESRIRTVQEKVQKENKGEKNNTKKVIRLGQDRPLRTINTTNMGAGNRQALKMDRREGVKTTEEEVNSTANNQPYGTVKKNDKNADMATILLQINKTVSKLQTASEEYRRTIAPLEVQILTEQILYLQNKLVSRTGFLPTATSPQSRLCAFMLELKQKLTAFFTELTQNYKQMFQGTQQKEQVSDILRDKCLQMSEIKLNFNELLEQNNELSELNSFLEKAKGFNLKCKETQIWKTASLSDENQFLSMYASPFQPITSKQKPLS